LESNNNENAKNYSILICIEYDKSSVSSFDIVFAES